MSTNSPLAPSYENKLSAMLDMFFSNIFPLQFLNLDVLALHSFVLEADAQGLVDGHDGMLLVTVLVGIHHAEVKVELDGLPCLLRV